jgi:endonuclease/exonuclease/phosphatase family metal-dependent hydrolase
MTTGVTARLPGRRRLVAAALAFAALAGGCAGEPPVPPRRGGAPAPGDPGRLRVVTLNVFHGGVFSTWTGDDHDLEARLAMVIDELRALDPDVIGLQEASTGRLRGDVAERVAEALGHHVVRGPVIGVILTWLLGFSEGPAILSRYPITAWEAHRLPSCEDWWEPRIVVYAEVKAPGGPLPVFSTHTSGETCQSERIAELVQERRRGRPAIVMGDFNAVESSEPIGALTGARGFLDAFRAANPDAPGPTVWQHVRSPRPTVRRRVDYVFVAPGEHGVPAVLGSRVVVDAPRPGPDGAPLWPTDHYGVLADLRLGTGPATARTTRPD